MQGCRKQDIRIINGIIIFSDKTGGKQWITKMQVLILKQAIKQLNL